MVKLLIATNNLHKIGEYQEILAELPVELTYPANEGLTLDPEETGTTFEENALIKARAFVEASGLPTLADDSGLEVDALGGEPGVYSARYGNTARYDQIGRYQLVLDKLTAKNLPWAERTARFRCVVAVARDGGTIDTVEGTVEGFIAYEPQGSGGFGYDPIFYVPEFDRTLAQMTSAEKHRISHRGRAARAALPLIKRLIEDD
jgi:XTP/dITP diphosphohydrolase